METLTQERVLVIDFGSQVTHLICRRCRELNCYSELRSCLLVDVAYLEDFGPKAVILSGGPASVYDDDAPHLSTEVWSWLQVRNMPVLGICYGLQEMMHTLGGKTEIGSKGEFGHAELTGSTETGTLFKDVANPTNVWMSHRDKVTALAPGFRGVRQSGNSEFAAVQHETLPMFGVQFHPEVTHTKEGTTMLKNFLELAGVGGSNWTMEKFLSEEIENIRKIVGEDCYVLGAVSGGVDSSVGAAMTYKAIGSRFKPFLVDTGLLRKDEAKECQARLNKHIDGMDLKIIDASDDFYRALAGITEPEKKRKTIGKLFVECFEKAVAELLTEVPIEKCFLLQGTLYPDVIESTSFKGPSSVIKSHHNVGGLPEKFAFKGLLEPLRMLFKDEVRRLGVELGLPHQSVQRHPFPGPGLAIRIVGGEITRKRADVLREADAIYLEELYASGEYYKIGQAFAVLLPETKTVGVMGDSRTYESVLALRAVQTSDFMTADWYPMDYGLLGKISNRIINEVRGINRVVYDVSSKPPATIEWE